MWYLIYVCMSQYLKICTICLFRLFWSNSVLLWWISFIYFNFCAALLWLFMWHILKVIWRSMHWHLSVIVKTKVLFFTYKNFIEETKVYIRPLQLLCLIIWQQHHFATIINFSILSFFHHSRDIQRWFIKNVLWIFRVLTYY